MFVRFKPIIYKKNSHTYPDYATEYQSSAPFLVEHGIFYLTSLPYTLQHNDFFERHRTTLLRSVLPFFATRLIPSLKYIFSFDFAIATNPNSPTVTYWDTSACYQPSHVIGHPHLPRSLYTLLLYHCILSAYWHCPKICMSPIILPSNNITQPIPDSQVSAMLFSIIHTCHLLVMLT